MATIADRIAVVTGASSGIGRATAEAFADQGAAVALVARRGDVLDDLDAFLDARGDRYEVELSG